MHLQRALMYRMMMPFDGGHMDIFLGYADCPHIFFIVGLLWQVFDENRR